MAKFFLLWLIVPFPALSYSQTSSKQTTIYGKVTYIMFTHLRALPIEQPSVLYFSKDQSVFIHSKGPEGIQEIKGTNEGSSVIDGWYQDSIGCVFFKDRKNKKLIIREFAFMQPYLTEEPSLPAIRWTICSENKQIGSFKCEKAITDFRGRHYTAWFTSDIPISDGPWKFYGLPGLILDVYDSTGEVKFKATEIEIPAKHPYPIQPPVNGKKVNFQTFKKAEDIEFEKARQQIESAQEDREGKMKVVKNKIKHIELEYEW